MSDFAKGINVPANDCISRQAAIDALDVLCQEHRYRIPGKSETYSQYNEAWQDALGRAENAIGNLPSAQPEQPPYVAEIEAEYQKAVKMPHIHKPLAKALYEVWKKHDREDAERRTDEDRR